MFKTLMKMCFIAVVQKFLHNWLMLTILILNKIAENSMDVRDKIKYEDVYIVFRCRLF